MKSMIVLFAIVSTIPAFADRAGTFIKAHEIGMYGFPDEADCKSDNGRWEDGICYFETEDSVTVKRTAKPFKYEIEIETITTNGNSCSFSGPANHKNTHQIVATAMMDVFIPGKNPEDDWILTKERCDLTVTYVTPDKINVTVSDGRICAAECGHNARLTVDGATRK